MRARTCADGSVPAIPCHEPSRIAIIASHASRSRSDIVSSVGPIVISVTPGSMSTSRPAAARSPRPSRARGAPGSRRPRRARARRSAGHGFGLRAAARAERVRFVVVVDRERVVATPARRRRDARRTVRRRRGAGSARARRAGPAGSPPALRELVLGDRPRWTSSGPSASRSVRACAYAAANLSSPLTPRAPKAWIARSMTRSAMFAAPRPSPSRARCARLCCRTCRAARRHDTPAGAPDRSRCASRRSTP